MAKPPSNAPQFKIVEQVDGLDAIVVQCEKVVDFLSSAEWERWSNLTKLNSDVRFVIADLTKTSIWTEFAPPEFASTQEFLEERGGALLLVNIQKRVSVIMELLGMDSLFRSFATVDKAKAWIRETRVRPAP